MSSDKTDWIVDEMVAFRDYCNVSIQILEMRIYGASLEYDNQEIKRDEQLAILIKLGRGQKCQAM